MSPAHAFALFWSQCLSDSARGVSWDLTLTNLFLVIVRFAICNIMYGYFIDLIIVSILFYQTLAVP